MLLTDKVEIKLNSNIVKHFENLGYKLPKILSNKTNKYIYDFNTFISVDVLDLNKGNKIEIELQCDYCGKTYTSKYCYYYINNISRDIHKDACINCSHLKQEETMILKYGVKNPMKLPKIQEKFHETCFKKYGTLSYMHTKEFFKKSKETCLEKYGYEIATCNDEIKEKIRNSQNFKIEDIRKQFEDKGYYLLTDNYINNDQTLEYICLKHKEKGIQTTKYINFNGIKDNCEFCIREKKSERYRHDFTFVKSIFEFKELELLETNYINEQQKLKFICKKHPNKIQSISFNALYHQDQTCYECSVEKRSGENHYNWKGGITDLSRYMRLKLISWKEDSSKNCNYKCVITGQKFNDIHHLYSFNKILKETLDNLSLELKIHIGDYTNEELISIENEFERIHKQYPLGVCLSKDIHTLYHSIYGDDNTPEQFEEFQERYLSGEFNQILN